VLPKDTRINNLYGIERKNETGTNIYEIIGNNGDKRTYILGVQRN
jgi:hypothetical protein